MTLTVRS